MSRGLHLRLTPRLTLVFVLFATALLVFVGVLAYYSGRSGLEDATVATLLSEAVEKEAALDEWIQERQSDLAMMAASPGTLEAVFALVNAQSGSSEAQAARDRLVAELQFTTLNATGFMAVFVMHPETGRVIAATDSDMEGTYREDRPFFINGKNSSYIQNPYYILSLRRPVMTLSMPLQGGDGRLLAVLSGHLDLNDLNPIIARRTGLQQTDDAFLVNTENLFVTQPRLLADPVVLQRGVHTEAVKRCLSGKSGVLFGTDYRDIAAIIAYRWLAERQLCLIVKMDQAEAIASVQAFGATLAVIGIVALVAASLLGTGLARTITRPILNLQSGVTRFGRGELDVRLPEDSHDELGLLAHEFNVMAVALTEKEQRVIEQAAQLEASNPELEAFSYSVSHDLRAPLRAIDGFSRILLRDYAIQLPEPAQRYLNLIRDNSQQMGSLIDDLLRLSRLNRESLNRERVNLVRMVQRVVEELSSAQSDRQVEITVSDLPEVRADPVLLKQVFVNLLSNALKFTRQCAVARIDVGYQQTNRETIYTIKDNGAGFDMAYADKLFGVFQRLHRVDEYPGTGVGLAIVQRIVHRHGGRIWAEAEVDKGATFYFTLEGENLHD